MTANTENPKARDAIKIKSVRNASNKTRHTHCQATLIRLTKVIIRARDAIRRTATGKRNPIKLCVNLTAKLLTTAYKLKIIKSKLDEDPIHRRINFLTFIESLEMIFSQYKETCEVFLDYPKIGGENIKYFLGKAIKNILHTNINVNGRIYISELLRDRV